MSPTTTALTIQYRHTFSYGLTAQLHYTWSHALGTVGYENPFNLSNSATASLNFDNRHQLAGDLVWTQPHKFRKQGCEFAASGWTVGTKLYLYSGAPFSVTDSKIPSQVNSAGGVLDSSGGPDEPQRRGRGLRKGRRKRRLPEQDRVRYLYRHFGCGTACPDRLGQHLAGQLPRTGLFRYRRPALPRLPD